MPHIAAAVISATDLEETRQLMLSPLTGEPDLAIPPLSVSESQASASVSGNVQTDKFLDMLRLSHIWTRPYNAPGHVGGGRLTHDHHHQQQQQQGQGKEADALQIREVQIVIVDTNAIDIDDI